MNAEKEKVMKRIRKMLKMAEGKGNANEAGVAASMAEKLMRKYNLSHADVELQDLDEDSIIAHESKIKYGARIPTWVGALIVSTAQLHDCEAKYQINMFNGRAKKVVTFLGERADVIVAAWVFEYLNKEIRRLANNFKAEHGVGRREADAFRKGAAVEVNAMLRRMLNEKETELQSHSTGKELMIVKRSLVQQKFNVKYGKAGTMNLGDQFASEMGRRAGRAINIRKGIEGNTQAQRRLA